MSRKRFMDFLSEDRENKPRLIHVLVNPFYAAFSFALGQLALLLLAFEIANKEVLGLVLIGVFTMSAGFYFINLAAQLFAYWKEYSEQEGDSE